MKKIALSVVPSILGLWLLVATPLASAQLNVGNDLQIKAGGLLTAGYSGNYGDSSEILANHNLNFGFDGTISGSYYNPNFLSFNLVPYYNRSQANSNYQSITGARGITGTMNLFSGSHFPGSISYRNDHNSTGTFGLSGQPNFTTQGHGDGFGVSWSALLPDKPTLSVSYSQGRGTGTIYGTDQQTGTDTKLFNIRSTYLIEGFRVNGYFDHNNLHSEYPAFLVGQQESISNTNGHDFGFGANRNMPYNGTFYASYNRSTASTDFLGNTKSTTHYTTDTQTSGVTFHPFQKLSVFTNESYTNNLSGFLTENLTNGTTEPAIFDLGSGSHSLQLGGGATYQFTSFLSTQAQATHYDQHYFGRSFSGTFISGNVNYSRRILNMFSFSAGVVEASNAEGSNSIGFVGNVNYFHRIHRWETSGSFSYAQNVQSVLVTYTASYYNYTARLHRRFGPGLAWIAAYNGSRSGLTNQPGSGNNSNGYSTSLSSRRFAFTGNYSQSTGQSVFTSSGLVNVPTAPGVPISELILYNAHSYGGGISITPVRRLVLSANFNRALSDTSSSATNSHNNTEIFNTQLQYHLRRIGVLAGYTRFTQGISVTGAPPGTANSYFIGVSRWFDFF